MTFNNQKNKLHPATHVSVGILATSFLTSGSLECGCNSVVECKLPKLDVAGSNPVARFWSFINQGVR